MSPVREENLILCNAPLVGGAMDVTAEQVKSIIDATADAGWGGVSLWAFHHYAAVGQGKSPEEVRAWHTDRGLQVPIVESLIGWEGNDEAAIAEQCGGTFEVASFYGAKAVAGVVMAPEMDRAAAVKGLALLGKMGADRGLQVCIEWLPWTALNTIKSAWELVQDAGGDNIGLVFDTWHWLRQPGGPDPDTLRQIPGDRIHCVQLDDATATSDAEDQMMESMTNRLLPGEGDVDWPGVLGMLDEIGADPLWAPEVFNVGLMQEGPVEMARKTREATRKVLGL